jgi:hypothetical protein
MFQKLDSPPVLRSKKGGKGHRVYILDILAELVSDFQVYLKVKVKSIFQNILVFIIL